MNDYFHDGDYFSYFHDVDDYLDFGWTDYFDYIPDFDYFLDDPKFSALTGPSTDFLLLLRG